MISLCVCGGGGEGGLPRHLWVWYWTQTCKISLNCFLVFVFLHRVCELLLGPICFALVLGTDNLLVNKRWIYTLLMLEYYFNRYSIDCREHTIKDFPYLGLCHQSDAAIVKETWHGANQMCLLFRATKEGGKSCWFPLHWYQSHVVLSLMKSRIMNSRHAGHRYANELWDSEADLTFQDLESCYQLQRRSMGTCLECKWAGSASETAERRIETWAGISAASREREAERTTHTHTHTQNLEAAITDRFDLEPALKERPSSGGAFRTSIE